VKSISLSSILRTFSIPQSNYLCLGHFDLTLEHFLASVSKALVLKLCFLMTFEWLNPTVGVYAVGIWRRFLDFSSPCSCYLGSAAVFEGGQVKPIYQNQRYSYKCCHSYWTTRTSQWFPFYYLVCIRFTYMQIMFFSKLQILPFYLFNYSTGSDVNKV